ncbi:EF-hand domain-containing protein [Durusdinium trenchii]|uniref:EF-hand domain-containing protein n=1 Tax=Durusdinium trenchii TaxID=1381693 RepID=A0ABP0MKR3_9DINO
MSLVGQRTTTWDRPPLAPALSRTVTLLESSRATATGVARLVVEGRAESSGWAQAAQPVAPVQVPPTTLQELRPLVVPQAPRAPQAPQLPQGPQAQGLLRLGTWSEAPAAPVSPWRVSGPLQRANTVTASGPVAKGIAQTGPVQLTRTLTQTVAPLQRANTATVSGIVLQRAGSMAQQPAPTKAPAPPASPLPAPLAGKAPAAVPISLGHAHPMRPLTSEWQVAGTAIRPLPTQVTEEQVPEIGRLLLQSAFGAMKEEEPPKQLRLIIGGLMGSGKSTICRMLRHLLQGTWINQDEFSHLGKGAKKAFLAAIAKAAADETVPALLVDKINTMKQHREEIMDAMHKGCPGETVFVQVKHPDDSATHWEHTLRLCESRIAKRGDGHRTLKAKTPQLKMILQRTVKGAEPLSKDEIRHLRGLLTVDMTQSSILQVMRLITDLDELDVLAPGLYDVDNLLSEQQLLLALEAAKKLEQELAGGETGENGEQKKKEKPLWYWAVRLGQTASEELLKTWRASEDHDRAAGSGIDIKEKDHHITMLYLGGGKDEEIAARNPRLAGPQQVAWLRDEFERRRGQTISFEVPSIVWEEGRAACAAVVLAGSLRQLCANEHPHITLGTAVRVSPVVSNELLARRAATHDLQMGLQAWLQQLSLGQYASQLGHWSQKMGAATPEELGEFAAEAADAVEDDQDSKERIAEVLQKAVQRPIHEFMLVSPLQLTGVLEGMLKGQ